MAEWEVQVNVNVLDQHNRFVAILFINITKVNDQKKKKENREIKQKQKEKKQVATYVCLARKPQNRIHN